MATVVNIPRDPRSDILGSGLGQIAAFFLLRKLANRNKAAAKRAGGKAKAFEKGRGVPGETGTILDDEPFVGAPIDPNEFADIATGAPTSKVRRQRAAERQEGRRAPSGGLLPPTEDEVFNAFIEAGVDPQDAMEIVDSVKEKRAANLSSTLTSQILQNEEGFESAAKRLAATPDVQQADLSRVATAAGIREPKSLEQKVEERRALKTVDEEVKEKFEPTLDEIINREGAMTDVRTRTRLGVEEEILGSPEERMKQRVNEHVEKKMADIFIESGLIDRITAAIRAKKAAEVQGREEALSGETGELRKGRLAEEAGATTTAREQAKEPFKETPEEAAEKAGAVEQTKLDVRRADAKANFQEDLQRRVDEQFAVVAAAESARQAFEPTNEQLRKAAEAKKLGSLDAEFRFLVDSGESPDSAALLIGPDRVILRTHPTEGTITLFDRAKLNEVQAKRGDAQDAIIGTIRGQGLTPRRREIIISRIGSYDKALLLLKRVDPSSAGAINKFVGTFGGIGIQVPIVKSVMEFLGADPSVISDIQVDQAGFFATLGPIAQSILDASEKPSGRVITTKQIELAERIVGLTQLSTSPAAAAKIKFALIDILEELRAIDKFRLDNDLEIAPKVHSGVTRTIDSDGRIRLELPRQEGVQ